MLVRVRDISNGSIKNNNYLSFSVALLGTEIGVNLILRDNEKGTMGILFYLVVI